MSGVIFLSYRRSDAEGEAGRLHDDLVRTFGAGAIFMDVSDIHPGKDFRQVITDNVSRCTALLAIIGPNWTSVTDAAGVRRLDQPNDFVRLEVGAALARGIDVIPVLVHGARMPTAAELPEDLQNLAYRNCVELTHARWTSEVELFSRTLRDYVHPKRGIASPPSKPAVQSAAVDSASSTKPPFRLATGLVLAAAVLGVIVWGIVSVHRGSAGAATAPVQPPPVQQAAAPASSPASTPAATPDAETSGRELLGWWYVANAPKLIPDGTPVVFYIGRHGDQFVVEMHASAGDGGTTASCGSQNVPLADNALSMVWDEPANPACHFIRTGYAANVRLYMAGDQLHMTLSGKYPRIDLAFKHQG
jgi:hypothetical protein